MMATPPKPGGRRDREQLALARSANRQLREMLQTLLETRSEQHRLFMIASMATLLGRQALALETMDGFRKGDGDEQ